MSRPPRKQISPTEPRKPNMRLRTAIDWSRWNWEDFNNVKPIVGQEVEVIVGINKVIRAIYDPKWETCFCNLSQTETLPKQPRLWRNVVGHSGDCRKRLEAEYLT